MATQSQDFIIPVDWNVSAINRREFKQGYDLLRQEYPIHKIMDFYRGYPGFGVENPVVLNKKNLSMAKDALKKHEEDGSAIPVNPMITLRAITSTLLDSRRLKLEEDLKLKPGRPVNGPGMKIAEDMAVRYRLAVEQGQIPDHHPIKTICDALKYGPRENTELSEKTIQEWVKSRRPQLKKLPGWTEPDYRLLLKQAGQRYTLGREGPI
ncbi:MAG: hypothetical protein RIM72_21360 [Alphaproteobacteria bacterium]